MRFMTNNPSKFILTLAAGVTASLLLFWTLASVSDSGAVLAQSPSTPTPEATSEQGEGASSQNLPADEGKLNPPQYPNLDSNLNQILQQVETGQSTARAAAANARLHREESVAVTLYVVEDDAENLVEYLNDNGASPRNIGVNYIEAYVPVSLLVDASEQEGVISIRTITPGQPDQGTVVRDSVSVHGATAWHDAGYKGQGVKIGVIDIGDGGFGGFSSLMGSELPAFVEARCYTDIGRFTFNLSDCETGDDGHGTAVTEALFDLAPDATYYIANPITPGDLATAVDWMIDHDVDVINHSVGWLWDGPGDGTSPYDGTVASPFDFEPPFWNSPLRTVNTAVEGGAIWINSAGNSATQTWSGAFSDPDGNGFHNFNGGLECNELEVEDLHSIITAQLRWNDSWGGATRDVDLQLYRVLPSGAYEGVLSSLLVGGEDFQSGSAGHVPLEILDWQLAPAGTYCLAVRSISGAAPDWIQLQIFSEQVLLHHTSRGSIGSPAESDNDGLLAVGAARVWDTSTIEEFSSRGPTPDGRVKPDIVGADGVYSSAYGQGFFGTSQAAPHVAGLAALVQQRFPDYTPRQVANYLKTNAEPRGTVPNNTWGHGFARLLPSDVVAPTPPAPAEECVSAVSGNEAITGNWSSACSSEGRSGSYASYYTFTLTQSADVTVTVESSVDTFLFLRQGSGHDGAELCSNDDYGSGVSGARCQSIDSTLRSAYDSGLVASLDAGSYTIEVTTFTAGETGAFTLTVYGLTATVLGPSTDRAALVALYNATDGPNWANNTNWLSDRPIGEWYGVTTNSEGRVIELVLYENNLIGSIPAELERLANLKILDFSNGSFTCYSGGSCPGNSPQANQLSGQVPRELGNLANLEVLNLRVNQLSGPVPRELGSLTNLEVLNLSVNQLSGSVPHELGNLTNLEALNLFINQLSGPIPPELANLANLESLDLRAGELNGQIPPQLGNLSNLRILGLGGQLTGQIPPELGNLTKLEDLRISHTQLSGRIPLELGNLSNLTLLNLSSNGLSGPIPSQLGNLANLRNLYLMDNELSGSIPLELGNLANLRLMYLAGNSLTGCIPAALSDVPSNDFDETGLPFCDDTTPPEPPEPPPSTDTCVEPLPDNGIVSGNWSSACSSEGISGSYASYYTFTLTQSADVTVTVESSVDTYLFLRQGVGSDGAELCSNDDYGSGVSGERCQSIDSTLESAYDSGLVASLGAGSYTIEVTTFSAGQTGAFTLTVDGLTATVAPAITITFGDLHWPSAMLQNRIAQYIAEMGYGHSTGVEFGATLPLFQALRAGNIDVLMEVWLHLVRDWEEALTEGAVSSPGSSLGSDWQSAFVIPKYLQEQYPDLDSVEDLKEERYRTLFATDETDGKARLLSCPVGWNCEVVNAKQVEGYGLSDHVHIVYPASGEVLNADLTEAYENEEPWLGYQWGTSDPALLLDLVRLEEPAYSDECWATTMACAYEDATILIAVNAGLSESAVDFVDVLTEWDFNVDEVYKPVFRWQTDNPDANTEAAAMWWLRGNSDVWSEWVTADASAAIQSALGNGEIPEGWPQEPNITPDPAPMPEPPADECVSVVSADGVISSNWSRDCASEGRSGSYASYYTFTLTESADVTITVESTVDTFLFLRQGAGSDGAELCNNDDYGSSVSGNRCQNIDSTLRRGYDSGLVASLDAGSYTIEVTTFSAGQAGAFTLTVGGLTDAVLGPSTDRAALVALYNATDGPNWTDNTNWLSERPIGEWYGVTTNVEGRVTALDLSSNDLSGPIASELGNLSNLMTLDLSSNYELSGSIPHELGNLSNLMTLDLSSNDGLSGSIPRELGSLANLELLYLPFNDLSGAIPPELGNLSNLEELELFANDLSGAIPRELGDLSNLELLRLESNSLSGAIPRELGNLSNLTRLSLRTNRLTGAIPSQLGNLSNLEDLWLSSNQLSGSMPAELGNLSSLRVLALSDNNLSGPIPSELGNLSNLRRLWLAENQLTGALPGSLTNLSLVWQFFFGANAGLCAPTDAAFQRWLQGIDTHSGPNCADAAPPGDRAALVALYNATDGPNWTDNTNWLSDRSIGDWYGVTTDANGRVTELHLGENQLSGEIPSELGSLTNLETLRLHANQLSGEIPSELGSLANLKRLDLWANRLSGSIPRELSRLTNLETLFLSSNNLSGEIPSELGSLSDLTSLDLRYNNLSGALPGSLTNLSLTYFRFQSNAGLCAPTDAAFQSWLQSIDTHSGPNCAAPDLVVSAPTVSDSSPTAGAGFTLRATVRNQGGAQSASTTLRYYRSTDSTIGSGDAQVGTDPVDSLAASAASAESISLTAPSSPGTYYYGACVDAVTGESDTANNCSTAVRVTVGAAVSPDRAALVALYNATDGPNWEANQTNWLSDRPIGEWYGVTTNAEGRVTELDLSSNDLTGPIPPELGDLSNLMTLDLSFNKLSGQIPSDLGNLSNLTSLDLGFNRNLSGSIPRELGTLSNLEHLVLLADNLSGQIPRELSNLSNLETLHLQGNNLSGQIPPELGNLSNLEFLHLGSNNLSGTIPSQLGNLSSLTSLHLEGNDLSGSIPSELSNLSNLGDLVLYGNNLSGPIPRELGSLSNLEVLFLRSNKLSGPIPPELGNLPNLRSLYLNFNQLTGAIPGNLTNLSLGSFYFGENAGLCAPTDAAFQRWLQSIRRYSGPNCS